MRPKISIVLSAAGWLLVAAFLVIVRDRFSYPLFHLLVELFAVTVAVSAFLVTWNARRYVENRYFVFLGTAYFFVAAVDLLHAVTYKGMNLVPGATSNLPTQLWLVARYLQGSALLIAPFFVRRPLRPSLVALSYGMAATVLVASIPSGLFPDAFIEGTGLTTFKLASEYVVVAAMLVGLYALIHHRASFERDAYYRLGLSITMSVFAELAFTLYTDPFGFPNFLGHMLRVVSYYALYQAAVVVTLDRPYRALFRELADTTETLRQREQGLRSTIDEASVGIGHIGLDGRFTEVNRRLSEMTGYAIGDLLATRAEDITHPDERITELAAIARMLSGDVTEDERDLRMQRADGTTFWASVRRTLMFDEHGRPSRVIEVVEDVTDRQERVEQLETARDLAAALTEIDKTVLSTFSVDEMLNRLVQQVCDALDAESAAVSVREPSGWVVRHTYRFAEDVVADLFSDDFLPTGVGSQVAGTPIAIDDAYRDSRVDGSVMRRHRIRSLLVIPLRLGDQVGALYVMHHHAVHSFTSEEIDFATKLAATLSIAVQNAALYDAQRRIADTLQGALAPTPETIAGLVVAHAYESATELARIGGDFYDVFEVRPDLVAIVIGDVSGKGLEAGTVTAMARSSIRAFAYIDDSPRRVLAAANNAIAAQTDDLRFVTATMLTIDMRSGSVRVACAGHPAPILCHPDGCEEDRSVRNPPLGILPDQQFDEYGLRLRPGDRIVLFTDGLIDARRGSDTFGEAGVRRVLDGLGDADPHEVVEQLLWQAHRHAGGTSADDVAVLVFRFLGVPPTAESEPASGK